MLIDKFPPFVRVPVAYYIAAIRVFAGVNMGLIVTIMIAQVFVRYALGSSLIWAEELCRYLLIWQTFLLLGMAYSGGEFVSFDIVSAKLTPRMSVVLKTILAVPIIVFLCLITYFGARYAARFSGQIIPAIDFIWGSLTGGGMKVSIYWVYIAVPAGSALMIVHVLADVIASLLNEFAGSGPRDADGIS